MFLCSRITHTPTKYALFTRRSYAKTLPDSLSELVLGNNFNKKLTKDMMPKNLKKIIFLSNYPIHTLDYVIKKLII